MINQDLMDKTVESAQPIVERTLTYLSESAIDNYERRNQAILPPDAEDRVRSMLRELYDISIPLFGTPIIESFKDCYEHLEFKQDMLFDRFVEEYMVLHAGKKIVQISQSTRADILASIRRGERDGSSGQEIAKDMRERQPMLTRFRSALIARTEMHGSMNYAQLRTAAESGRPLVKSWGHVLDDRTIDFGESGGSTSKINHRIEQAVDLEQKFKIPMVGGGHEELSYPGDPAGSGGNVINCRCSMSFKRAAEESLVDERPAEKLSVQGIFSRMTSLERLSIMPAFFNALPQRLAMLPSLPSIVDVAESSKGAWYSPGSFRITMDKALSAAAYKLVMRHEYGHHVAYSLAKKRADTTVDDISMLARPEIVEDAAVWRKYKPSNYYNVWKRKEVVANQEDARSSEKSFLSKISYITSRVAVDQPIRPLLAKELADREFDYDEVVEMLPAQMTGFARDEGSWDSRVNSAAALLAAIDDKDHHYFLNSTRYNHESVLSGLSDSLGAATNNAVGYRFGHKDSYYKNFRDLDKRRARMSVNDENLPYKNLGSGNSAQIWANWFEAYTSGNESQYTLFRLFFPLTSHEFEDLLNE